MVRTRIIEEQKGPINHNYDPGFESRGQHLRFFDFKLYLSFHCEEDKNKRKEARFGPGETVTCG